MRDVRTSPAAAPRAGRHEAVAASRQGGCGPWQRGADCRPLAVLRVRTSALLAVMFALAAPAWAAAPVTVVVDMTDKQDGSQVMRLDHTRVPAGKVSFEVTNQSANMVHEFLIVRTALAPDQFPMSKDDTKVDEKRLKGIKELGDLTPGKSGVLTLDLQPGHYVVFCNQTGHFKGGMHSELTVIE